MSLGERVAEAARGMVGTPFVHRGRRPGKALDCAGLVYCAVRKAGLRIDDFQAYGQQPDSGIVLEHLRRIAEPVRDKQAGDVLVFALREGKPNHLALWDGTHIVQADGGQTTMRVTRHGMSRSWSRRLAGIWRLRDG